MNPAPRSPSPAPVDLSTARRLTHWLDSAIRIPGTRISVGLDALLGLIPGGGDLAGAALSAYLVVIASRAGAPASVLTRMVGNVAIDAAVGTIPLLGDLFDIGWKANTRNLRLLEAQLAQPAPTARASRWQVGLVLAGLLGLFVLAVALVVYGLGRLFAVLGS